MTAVVRLAPFVLALTATACAADYGWQTETFETGIDVDLRAVRMSLTGGDFVAVGESGAVVTRANGDVDFDDIGDRDLRALGRTSKSRPLVVGDGGFAAVSEDEDVWEVLDLGVDADLHAIVGFGDSVVIIGDEVVLLEQTNGTWIPIPPPEGGWGRLRAGMTENWVTYFVGLEGIVWTTEQPFGPSSEFSGSTETTADLVAIDIGYDGIIAAGSKGALLLNRTGNWIRLDTDVTADFIGYSNGILLTAEGEILELEAIEDHSWSARLVHLDTFPGALGFDTSNEADDIAIVGASGLAARHWYEEAPVW